MLKMERTCRTVILFIFIGVLIYGCSTAPLHQSLENANLPKVISHRDFFMNQDDKFGFSISPDGKRVAWFEVEGKTRLFMYFKTIGKNDKKVFHISPNGRLSNIVWSRDNRHIFYYEDMGGNENYHIYCLDTEHLNEYPKCLTPGPNTRAQIIRTIQSDQDNIIIAHNRRDTENFDLYKINIETKEEKLLAKNPGDIVRWIVDDEGILDACIRKKGENSFSLEVIGQNQKEWEEVISWNDDDYMRVIDFSKDKKGLWLMSNRNRENVALVYLDLEKGTEELYYHEKGIDLEGFSFDRGLKKPLAVETNPDYQKIHFFDPDLREDYQHFNQEERFGLNITSSDIRREIFIVRVFSDKGGEYFLFDSNTGVKELLVSSSSLKYKELLSDTKPILFKSRDGLPINGYLTVPKGTDGKNLPTILLVHGGPWSRDRWIFNPMVQFLSNRGYAVLQINFRGSRGYGRDFLEKGVGEWAGKMHDDLVDGVQWAIEEGIADAQKIGIMGASYGGYAALVGLTFTPELFSCGVSLFGPSNLITLLESAPEYWKHGMPFNYRHIGNPNTPEGRQKLKDKSPLFRVENIKSPLLIVQGGRDVRVRQKESDQIVRAMRENDKDVKYLYFPEEGHSIRKWSNMLYFLDKLEGFLAKNLGGRNAAFGY